MKTPALPLALLGLGVVLAPAAGAADAPLRRIALVAGANRASAERIPLRYAVADAERFANVVTRLGGVAAADCLTLKEPTRAAFLAALESVRSRVTEARALAPRVEVILYYSGHADEKGLLLGRELIAYRELRQALAELSADVAIAVLDACASGAITRLKGGQSHPAFLTDASSQTSGYAFLTSSSENEAAQESQRIGGSYFTHALVSGLRGAADTSGDGKVTLGEAYQFAFHETLAQTAPTQAGAQHPSYDMKMSGTGDVVVTDLRQTSCSLVLDADMDGRFFVRNSRKQLVAELHKPAGRTVELGLEPGTYEVHFDQPRAYLKSRLTLASGQRLRLEREKLRPASRLATTRRGGIVDLPRSQGTLALDGHTRFEMRFGFSGSGGRVVETGGETVVRGGQFALSGTHWVREDLAVELAMRASDFEVRTLRSEVQPRIDPAPAGASAQDGAAVELPIVSPATLAARQTNTRGLFGLLVGVRYYVRGLGSRSPLRPYVSAGIGPFSEISVRTSGGQDEEASASETRLGGHLGGGVDFLIKRRFVVGAYAGATPWRGGDTRVGFGLTLGLTFGGGNDDVQG